ncbi:hypothetical protein WJX84_001821 [Apatococcus fuscideae]|uniref:Uncharacterized protein n=1 Tax=Apatococcus fuscideae TaxID=2026836 RepID=A0AAW1SZJ6_9CHLO
MDVYPGRKHVEAPCATQLVVDLFNQAAGSEFSRAFSVRSSKRLASGTLLSCCSIDILTRILSTAVSILLCLLLATTLLLAVVTL